MAAKGMIRGSLILVALPGDYGKPRPALAVQSSSLPLPSVVVCPLTTTIRPDIPAFRPTIEPSAANGLKITSQVMIDKPTTVPLDRVRGVIGLADEATLGIVTAGLAVLFDLT
jgi:mRNA interferase MazF